MAGTSSSASNAVAGSSEVVLKRDSNDVGWEYGMLCKKDNLDKWKCKLCGKEFSGGVYRIKLHIANIRGQISPCPRSTDEDKAKCKAALDEAKKRKNNKNKEQLEVRREVHITEPEEVEEEASLGKKPRTLALGPIDAFASSINPEISIDTRMKLRQQNIHDALWKERTHDVHRYEARWVYENNIAFHAVDNDSFRRFVEAVGQFGPGYQPPSQYLLREPLLKEECERTRDLLKMQKEEWVATGCSIMTDAWSDGKRRSIMNLCVNCKIGTTFLSSREVSEDSHTAEYIFEYVDKCIEDVGPKYVIQVVTDNASNNMAAADLMNIKRPNLFWTSCATHTLNLMLQGIGKMGRFKGVIERAKAFTIFIYAHHSTLAMMRKATRKHDIVRPGVTRFATAFLTLRSLEEKKAMLRNMFNCAAWDASKHSKTTKGKAAYATVLSPAFWSGVSFCLKVFAPLVEVLRLVDGDRKPSMAFLHGQLLEAKEVIKEAFKNVEDNYKPILQIIEDKGRGRLDTPLHLAAYFLNSYYFFKKTSIKTDPIVNDAILTCIENFFCDDFDMQNRVANIELLRYKNKEGGFGRPLAAAGCAKNDNNYDPVGWWMNYGSSTPNLLVMATKILSLTSSSSGCERNWSTFAGIHTKKRNRLDTERLNNLVYVQFNARLMNKKSRQKDKEIDVLLASDASEAQGWIVKDGDKNEDGEIDPGSGIAWSVIGEASGADDFLEPRRSARNVEVRELHEDDFESDEETDFEGEEDIDLDFDESD